MLKLPPIVACCLLWLIPSQIGWAEDASTPAVVPQSFILCANCHTVMAEGQHRNAPPLTDIIGRDIASWPGFEYSYSLRTEEGVWTKDKLDAFLQRPNHARPGTKMYFRGIESAPARAELIEWLAEATVPTILDPDRERPLYGEENPNMVIKIEEQEKAKTSAEELFRPCKACHSYSEGAPALVGPNLYGVYGRPVASFPGFHYSEHLEKRSGTWDETNLSAFFVENKSWLERGVHYAFMGLRKKEDRKTLIRFLKTLKPSPEAGTNTETEK